MAVWVIQCFHNDRGRDLFCEEYARKPARARAKFRTTLELLCDQPAIEGWCRENGFDFLTGKKYQRYRALGKVRVNAANAAHRPLGFFLPGTRIFVLLIWATERDGKFDPPNVLETALTRMHRVLELPELAHACDL